MKSLCLVLTFGLATSGCLRLRTDPEPKLPAPARSAETLAPPPKVEGPLDVRNCVELALAHAPSLRTAWARADTAAAGISDGGTAPASAHGSRISKAARSSGSRRSFVCRL
jgi:outer membrane protein TolC